VVGTVTVILLKWFVWKLLLEVDAVTVASGDPPSAHPLVHHLLGLNYGGIIPEDRTHADQHFCTANSKHRLCTAS